MDELLAKISSYNIFNYLFPGALFTVTAGALGFVHIPKFDIVTLLLLYYSAGLLISRMGSILVEPILKWIKFLRYGDYRKYVIACDVDKKIEVLVEQSNSYRTIFAGTVVLLAAYPVEYTANALALPDSLRNVLLIALIALLFLFSFRKQSNYVRKRVDSRSPPMSD